MSEKKRSFYLVEVGGAEYAAMYVQDNIGIIEALKLELNDKLDELLEKEEQDSTYLNYHYYTFSTIDDMIEAMDAVESTLELIDYDMSKNTMIYIVEATEL